MCARTRLLLPSAAFSPLCNNWNEQHCFSFPVDIVLIYTMTTISMCSTLILRVLFLRSLYKAKRSVNLIKDCSCMISWTWSCGLPYRNMAGSCAELSSATAWKSRQLLLEAIVFKEQFKLPEKVSVNEMYKWHVAALISILYSSNAPTLFTNSAPLQCQRHTFAGLMLASWK